MSIGKGAGFRLPVSLNPGSVRCAAGATSALEPDAPGVEAIWGSAALEAGPEDLAGLLRRAIQPGLDRESLSRFLVESLAAASRNAFAWVAFLSARRSSIISSMWATISP